MSATIGSVQVVRAALALAILGCAAFGAVGQTGEGSQEGRTTPPPARASSTSASPSSSCILCHGNAELFGEDASWVHVAGDAHTTRGISCEDCHGGNPDPGLAEDSEAAMDPDFAANPYRGVPEHAEIPGFCGRCHSDPIYMRRFQPDARVDQEREYWTSHHGRAVQAGDTHAATCVECHGAHGILGPGEPRSPVYPTHVAETCRGCHGDPQRMAGYSLPNGSPLPVDQYARWRESVHAHALLELEDLSAPTCNDCHGNHGASPPDVESVAYVCGRCHGREAELFRASGKAGGFHDHEGYLADAGADGCAACHETTEMTPAARSLRSFGECTACHDNHGIVRPTVAMLSPLPETPCIFCHESPEAAKEAAEDAEDAAENAAEDAAEDAAEQAAERTGTVRHYEETRDALLADAAAAGLHGDARFDHLLDAAVSLPEHTRPAVSEDGTAAVVLRPEFRRLYEKFRLGKTTYTYADPAGDGRLKASVIRCDDCHVAAEGEASRGREAAAVFLSGMHELTSVTAKAERMLLAARRGGVGTQEAAPAVDEAVAAQVELEVLVHSFDASAAGAFEEKKASGLEHAGAALLAAAEALEQLATRRRGLAVSLVLILLVLVGLGLKIRQLSEAERAVLHGSNEADGAGGGPQRGHGSARPVVPTLAMSEAGAPDGEGKRPRG